MRLIASLNKSLKENLRDWKVLVMVLVFSPFFVLLMYLFYGVNESTYHIGYMNEDNGKVSAELIKNLGEMEQNDAKIFILTPIENMEDLKAKVIDKVIDIGIVIPDDYSTKITQNSPNPTIAQFYGSMGNTKYTVAAIFAADAVYKQGMEIAKITIPSTIQETFLEKKLFTNEFEGTIPGLISLAVLMILFTASASIVKENDKKTLIRLKLSRLGAFNFLMGICIVQAVIATFAIILSYWTALALGYNPLGDFETVVIVGIISSFSMVAISLIVASFLSTIFDVLTIGCFPFFILMFFSGSMMPLPKMNILTIGGHAFGITDILPLTHTATAFNKILNFDASLSGVSFELGMITILSILYFALGLFLYQKRKLTKA